MWTIDNLSEKDWLTLLYPMDPPPFVTSEHISCGEWLQQKKNLFKVKQRTNKRIHFTYISFLIHIIFTLSLFLNSSSCVVSWLYLVYFIGFSN